MIHCILQLYLSLGTGENGLQCEPVVGLILPKYFFFSYIILYGFGIYSHPIWETHVLLSILWRKACSDPQILDVA